ncbi:hypothetical protein P3W45_000208 [Vairimorpha bombi]|jgi:anaphase-promoting complex subunit 3
MYEDIKDQIIKSYKYCNYENMAFLSSFLYSNTAKYKIMLPISLYYTQEYNRALSFLSRMNTTTSVFYEYLCLKNLKEYKQALVCLKKIVSNEVEDDDLDLDMFIVDKNDKEYFYNDIAVLYTQLYDRDEAIKYFKQSISIYPVFTTIENLSNEFELKDVVPGKKSYLNIKMKENQKNCKLDNKFGTSLNQFVSDIMSYDLILDKYKHLVPGIGSYALSFYAKYKFELGFTEESKKLFYFVRSLDHQFLHNMDYFSTVLWHLPEITELGILCKNLIIDSPNSPITWKALGNFYNHKNDYKRSMLCLERSLYLLNDSYTLNLLGFESVYKNEYTEALEFFKKSMLMLKKNYKSMYGCALVYDKMDKKSSAEFYYKKCMYNNQLRVMGMKFFIKHGEMDTAICIYKEGIGFESSDINRLAKMTVEKKGSYSSVEEFLILEFVEILAKLNLLEFAKNILNIIEYRGDTYYKKKEIVYEKKHSFI